MRMNASGRGLVSNCREGGGSREILQYLARHLKVRRHSGGCRCSVDWRHHIDQTVHELSKVLDFLAARDFIVECRGPDTRLYHKISRQKLERSPAFWERLNLGRFRVECG